MNPRLSRIHRLFNLLSPAIPGPALARHLFSAALFASLGAAAVACDTCALYLARGPGRHGFFLSTAHQFTRLGRLWEGDREVPNPAGQYVDSHITQLSIGYARGGAWQAQLTLPYISRSYLRPDHARIERSREAGVGDLALAGRYRVWQTTDDRGNEFALSVLGGVEFGTGNADYLEPADHHHHHFVPSGVHDHDLALGSGSTDWLVGADAAWTRGRYLAHVQWQRKLCTTGAFDYRIADETWWEVAAGRYLLLDHQRTLAVHLLFLADRKGLDSVAGAVQADTGASVRYVGTRVSATLGRRFETDVALDLPVRIRTSDTMIAPNYRIRAAANWRF